MSRIPPGNGGNDGDSDDDDETQMISVEQFDSSAACVLIRNLLPLSDQKELFEYIQENDKTPTRDNNNPPRPRPMVPSPQTLLLGEDGNTPTIKYGFGDVSIVTRMVEKACNVLKTKTLNFGFDDVLCQQQQYKSLSMATIRYEAPGGHFPPHVDHCDDSFVFLISLGCTANFMVKAPDMATEKTFKFRSGDMLVFDASSKASILHSVVSIDDEATSTTRAGELLGREFPILQNHRYGVQCRMNF